MSKLNINRNIFLEREELLRWQQFLLNSNVNQLFLANTVVWGIIDTSGGVSPVDFEIITGTNSGTVKIENTSKALTESGLLIVQEALDNISVPSDGNYYWIKISHVYSKVEEGECSVSVDGQVAGSGTFFSDVLRGQSTEVPVKIKFLDAANNTSIYEVVEVTDDDNIILLGDTFFAESGLKYYVIGSTPLGDTITTEQQEGLYFYDSCQIDFVAETIFETEPAGKVQDSEFWIARVVNNSGTVTIEDKRDEYWEYFIRGITDKLDRNLNLSDVENVSASRINLDVYSKGEVEELVGEDSSDWLAMDRGANVNSSGFDVKIKRLGNLINITGSFNLSSTPPSEAVLFSIPYSSIGESKAAPTTIIRFQISTIETFENNHGIQMFIPVPTDPSAPAGNLEVKYSTSYVPSATFGKVYFFNLTFITG